VLVSASTDMVACGGFRSCGVAEKSMAKDISLGSESGNTVPR
jgi:hypothetical protein